MSFAWKAVSVAALSAIAFIGCSKTDQPSPSAAEKQAEVKKEPITLNFFYQSRSDWEPEVFMTTFGEPIQKKYPYITVHVIPNGTGITVDTLLASGQTIDVHAGSPGTLGTQLIPTKLQYDITPQIKTFNYDLNLLDPSMVAQAKEAAGGGMYGLPVLTPPVTTYYSKDIFNKFGVAYPKDGMTWDDLYEINRKLTRSDGGVQYFGLAAPIAHIGKLNQKSLQIVDPKTNVANLESDGWKQMAELLAKNYQIPGYPSPPASVTGQREQFFKLKTAAMWLDATTLHNSPELDPAMSFDLASFPSYKELPGVGTQPYPTYFHITSQSKYKDDAFQAIAYLTSKEFQLMRARAGVILPVLTDRSILKEFGQDSPIYKGKNVSALLPQKFAVPSPFTPYNDIVSTEFYNAVYKHLGGKADFNTALREGTEIANQKIKAALAQ
ncbi:MAG: extracellular solute-binding protein family 1 [Paenibacillus sp.]|jgi:multiple sugar transport system substrate-binding protein|nr:extracellular solute-binding protein family 1 [Paenibacillus sp.]